MSNIPADQWVYVTTPLFFYGIIVGALFAWGFRDDSRNPLLNFFRSISAGLERVTGYPGWAVAGGLSCLWALANAALGLYWDVAFHIDYGRDDQLFTPSHTMIVLGLSGIVYAAGIAVLFATLDKADVGVRFSGLRIPYSAMAMAALGLGGLAAFPLDELWHRAYGIDITLWSPTHLQLVGGGALATLTAWLMLVEGHPRERPTMLGRLIGVLTLSAILVGTSTPQGEFDFGVPQFQVLYLPILIAAAGAFTLVLARVALGRFGAFKALAGYIFLRSVFGLVVAEPLNETFPRFPLYLATALVVEAVASWLGTEDRLRYALVAGAGIGTVGMMGELAWIDLSGWAELNSNDLLRYLLVVPATAAAAAVLGAALTRPVPGRTFVPVAAAGAAGTVLIGALLFPLPRNVGDVAATIRLTPAGADFATVEIDFDDPGAAASATAFGVVAWQGGGRVSASLEEVAPGRYVSSRPLPITGSWKTMVGLQRKDEVMAAPVYLPADPEYDQPEIPALSEREVTFVKNTDLLLREMRDGPAWPALLGYGGLATMIAVWTALVAYAANRVARQNELAWAAPPAPRRPEPVSVRW
ncbi:MAG: hypothetical protein ACRD0M_02200 [Acidimicrobiales bacterium]